MKLPLKIIINQLLWLKFQIQIICEFWTESTSIEYFHKENWVGAIQIGTKMLWGGLDSNHPINQIVTEESNEIIEID